MTTLSNHVPDPRLITAFAERRDGPLHRVNPWTKVGVVGALVLAVTVFDRLVLLAGLYGVVLVVYGFAGLPYRRLAGWYTLPMLFIVSVAGPLAFLEPGTPIGGALRRRSVSSRSRGKGSCSSGSSAVGRSRWSRSP